MSFNYKKIGFEAQLKAVVFTLLLCLGISWNGIGQQAISTLLGAPLEQADEAYINGNYQLALQKYLLVERKDQSPKNIYLRIARSYYFTHHYSAAADSYKKHLKTGVALVPLDLYYFAESLTSSGEYDYAVRCYTDYLKSMPNKSLVSAKIWRINNLTYLFEDSLKNAVHFAAINTEYSEIQMLSYGKGVLFTSNQPTTEMIKKINKNGGQPFYHTFHASTKNDPFSIGAYFYDEATDIGSKLHQAYNIGPIATFDHGKQMVYAANSQNVNDQGFLSMQLYFAKKEGSHWQNNGVFSLNDVNQSINSVSINEEGNTLYFSADIAGGFGGKDLYVSHKENDIWRTPENLGSTINTEFDEVFPFIHSSGVLYFASNGHPGMGGLDIYKASVNQGKYSGIENLGFPINSGYDDFAFSIDSLKRQGFLSSNRLNGGMDDDIYEIDMNLQSYPLEINGLVKFIEHNWMDTTQLELLTDVKMELIDMSKNIVVAECVSSELGTFQFTIPYYSQYKIHITGKGLDGMVSFEAPKYAKEDQTYQIVVVNDDFKEKLRE